ncbi:MAG: FHA domain-containing protein [Lachnospiraceae bacterium]|nr:FHA domain-containing protein [Lachnospiraceae bacterium]
MIRIEQERDLGHQIMTVRREDEEEKDSTDFREQMLLHNRIDGMIPFEIRTEAGDKVYEYDIENLISLSEHCEGKKPGKSTLDRLLKGILAIVTRGREFMLAEDDYIVSPDSVFIDKNENVYMAYYPGYGENLRLQLRDLAEYLMNEVDYADEAAVLSVYGFYMRTKEAGTTFEDLMNTLVGMGDEKNLPQTDSRSGGENMIEIKREPLTPHISADTLPQKATDVQPRTSDDRDSSVASESGEEVLPIGTIVSESPLKLKLISILIPLAAAAVYAALAGSGVFTGSTGRFGTVKAFLAFIVLAAVGFEAEKRIWRRFAKEISEKFRSAREQAEEETVLLYGGEGVGYAFSLVSDTDPPINVSHFPFFVGKDASRCDYCMASQVGVSRFHMKIDRDGEDFTVSDLNSTNGTYVNGERLAPHYPKKVRRGDELRIGKCIYYCN